MYGAEVEVPDAPVLELEPTSVEAGIVGTGDGLRPNA